MKALVLISCLLLLISGVGGGDNATTTTEFVGSCLVILMAITLFLFGISTGKDYWKIPKMLMLALGIILASASLYFLPRVQGIPNLFFTTAEFITGFAVILLLMIKKPIRNRLLNRV